MEHHFTTVSGEQLCIDSKLIEQFDFQAFQSSNYLITDQFYVKGWLPKEYMNNPRSVNTDYASLFDQMKTYNEFMYKSFIFKKILTNTDKILKRPEFFLLRFPALYFNHGFKQKNTIFTLGSLLESWKYFSHLHTMDDMGEVLLITLLYPQHVYGYRVRGWSTERQDFTEMGIMGAIDDCITEFESLNKRYPWQLKNNHTYARQLIKEIQ
jgi:hypothetical protein